jgi:Tfp pilus assembly protein FimV
LGEIRLNSYLNQPLSAEIALNVGSADELETLRVELASRGDLRARYGLDRPPYFDGLQLRGAQRGARASGRSVQVTSSRADDRSRS